MKEPARERGRQQDLWIAGGGDPGQSVLDQLNRILNEHWFDTAVEHLCRCSTSARWLAEDRELRIPGSGKHGHWIEVFSMFRRYNHALCSDVAFPLEV